MAAEIPGRIGSAIAVPAKTATASEIMDERLRAELWALAVKPGQEELVLRLKKLTIEGHISKTVLFEFLNYQCRWSNGQMLPIVFPATITMLGNELYQETGLDLKNLVAELYQLAASRRDSRGASAFAYMLCNGEGVEKNYDRAFDYANFGMAVNRNAYSINAVAFALLKKNQYTEAVKLLLETTKPIEIAGFLLEEVEAIKANATHLASVRSQAEFLLSSFEDVKLKNKCYYIIGLVYYHLGDYSKAMLDFVNISKDDPHYHRSTSVKRNCYLRAAETILGMKESKLVLNDNDKKDEEKRSESVHSTSKISRTISLYEGSSVSVSFKQAWKKDSKGLSDMVDRTLLMRIKDAWQGMLESTREIIYAKQEVLKRSAKYKQDGLISPQVELPQDGKAKQLEEDLKTLHTQWSTLENAASGAMPENRRRFRRAKAEARYFNPAKTKPQKKEELFGLYQEILAARFAEPATVEVGGVLPLPTSTSLSSTPAAGYSGLDMADRKEEVILPFTPAPQVNSININLPTAGTQESPKVEEKKEIKKEKGAIYLDGRNARQVYRAERLFQQAGIQLLGSAPSVGRFGMRLGIPHDSDKITGSAKINYADKGAGPSESWQAGESTAQVVHAIVPARQRLGNVYLTEYGNYNDIYGYLYQIAGGNKAIEKLLAGYMIRYTRTFTPTTLEELRAINPQVTERMVAQFHAVCLLVGVKEQTQWLSSEDETYKTGLAVAQARCLILLREGYLTFEQVFPKSAEFGVFSQEELLSSFGKVETAIQNIETIYLIYFKAVKGKEHASFFAKYRDHEMVLTRQQARLDLREVYGGEESEADEEGYASDVSYDGGP